MKANKIGDWLLSLKLDIEMENISNISLPSEKCMKCRGECDAFFHSYWSKYWVLRSQILSKLF